MEKEPESRGPFFFISTTPLLSSSLEETRCWHPRACRLTGTRNIHPPKHTRWPCSWHGGITFRTFFGEDKSLKPPKLSRPAARCAPFHRSCCCCWAGGIHRGFGRGVEAPA